MAWIPASLAAAEASSEEMTALSARLITDWRVVIRELGDWELILGRVSFWKIRKI